MGREGSRSVGQGRGAPSRPGAKGAQLSKRCLNVLLLCAQTCLSRLRARPRRCWRRTASWSPPGRCAAWTAAPPAPPTLSRGRAIAQPARARCRMPTRSSACCCGRLWRHCRCWTSPQVGSGLVMAPRGGLCCSMACNLMNSMVHAPHLQADQPLGAHWERSDLSCPPTCCNCRLASQGPVPSAGFRGCGAAGKGLAVCRSGAAEESGCAGFAATVAAACRRSRIGRKRQCQQQRRHSCTCFDSSCWAAGEFPRRRLPARKRGQGNTAGSTAAPDRVR